MMCCNLQFKVQQAHKTFPYFCQQRCIEVDTHGQVGEELSEKDYHRLADLTLGEVMVKLESLIEETEGIADSDLEYSQVQAKETLGTACQDTVIVILHDFLSRLCKERALYGEPISVRST